MLLFYLVNPLVDPIPFGFEPEHIRLVPDQTWNAVEISDPIGMLLDNFFLFSRRERRPPIIGLLGIPFRIRLLHAPLDDTPIRLLRFFLDVGHLVVYGARCVKQFFSLLKA